MPRRLRTITAAVRLQHQPPCLTGCVAGEDVGVRGASGRDRGARSGVVGRRPGGRFAAVLSCAGCGGSLKPRGNARPRSIRQGRGGRREVRPRRVRCRACRVTHVLLPASCLPRRADTVEVVGAALLAKAHGKGHRAIAAELGLPPRDRRGRTGRTHLRRHRRRARTRAQPRRRGRARHRRPRSRCHAAARCVPRGGARRSRRAAARAPGRPHIWNCSARALSLGELSREWRPAKVRASFCAPR